MTPPNPNAKLWLLDFDNTLATLEREVDWPGSRRELEAYLRAQGVEEGIFAEIPKGNLPLYAALHSRWLRAPRAVRAASAISPRAVAPGGAVARTPIPPPDAATNPAVTPPAATPHGAAALSAGMPLARAEALLRHASEIIERHELVGAERAAPTPGVIDLLRAIAARDAIAIIVTSNSSRTVAHWLDRHRVADLVYAIVGRDSLLALKPSPEMIARAIELTAIPAAETVFVGDSEADLGAARAAGVGFYRIVSSESDRHFLIAAGATDLFTSPAALHTYLNRVPSQHASDSKSN
jgi:HAD superfamily hydrolase (TIGR01509 family)